MQKKTAFTASPVELNAARNEVVWFGGDFDPARMKFEFNQLWFDAPFTVRRF